MSDPHLDQTKDPRLASENPLCVGPGPPTLVTNLAVSGAVILTPVHNLTIWRCVVADVCPIGLGGVGHPVGLDHPRSGH